MKSKALSLYHLIRPSIQSDSSPLILMLHGYGSDEKDLFSFANYLPERFTVISARAPYPLIPIGNAWYAINFDANANKFSDTKQAVLSRDKVKVFINEAIETYSLDRENITLMGFSQGTILSYAVALTYPNLIKNIIGLSGYIDKNMVEEKKENYFKNIKAYTSHGKNDQVIPIEWSRKTPEILDKYGINYTYKEYTSGHAINQDNFKDMLNWINQEV